MAKDKISDYSSTANSNTDIAGINIDEGCAPSGINDAIRTLMAQLKNFQTGTGGDSFNGPVGSTTASTGAFTTLSATGVASFAAGSASAPAITRTGDTNTGIFFPAADTVGITTGGTERARVDSSGNLGLGVTPSSWGSGFKSMDVNTYGAVSSSTTAFRLFANSYGDGTNWIYKTTAAASRYDQSGGSHAWQIAPSGTAGNAITFTQAMTLDASGNLGVGTTSPAAKFEVYNSSVSATFAANTLSTWRVAQIRNDGTSNSNNAAGIAFVGRTDVQPAGIVGIQATTGGGAASLAFLTVSGNVTSESARINSSGQFLLGATAAPAGYSVTKFYVAQSSPDYSCAFDSTNSTAGNNYGLFVKYTNASPNGTGNEFYAAADNTAVRFQVRSNGGVANYQANNVNLSDRREKTNFAPAGDYLAKICAIPVQTFNYIDQNIEEDDGLTLGVVAQDVQAVAPELVMESNWANKDEEPKMRLSIYQTDLQYALMKCIQEQQAIITALTARITALEQA